MKPMDKGWIVWLALVMGVIGALPVSGQSAVFWGGSTLGYDSAGRLECVFSSRMDLMATFEYDGAGNLAWRVMPDQDVTSYGYDGMNRLLAVTNQGSVVSSMGYDRNGNTVAHATPLASGSLGYDAMNHLIASTQTVNSATAIVRYGYDLNGNRTNIVYPGGLTVGYVFDAGNRLENVRISAPSAPSREIHFSYDTANRMTGISYPNGINSAFGYDADSRVTNIVHGTFVDRKIIRNALGFKETELINAGLKPTVPATARSLKTHNDADQLVSESIQTDVANWTSVIYSYSANGCLTNQQSEIGNRHYQYDYDNRLESVSSAQSAVQYLYVAS